MIQKNVGHNIKIQKSILFYINDKSLEAILEEKTQITII